MKNIVVFTFSVLIGFSSISQNTDTVSVMIYNLLKFPAENPSRISVLKNIVQEDLPDVLMVCELTSASGANAILSDALNQNGITYYDKSTYIPSTDTENMLYYNSNKLVLFEQNVISTDLRDISEYVLYYKSSDLSTTADTTFFFMYMCHLKAGQSDSYLRNEMAIDLKEYMASRSNIENVVLGGDFNVYGSSEPVWNTILNGSGVNLVDPINTPGEWHNDWGFADIHTQSTRTASFDTGATGGMDDRFDIIFLSPDLMDWSAQARYIDGTYWAYGQDGNHFNAALTDNPVNVTLPSNIIQDLHDMSDHLPVYLEIELQSSFNSVNEKLNEMSAYHSLEFNRIYLKNVDTNIHDFRIFDLSGKLVKNVSDEEVKNGIGLGFIEKGVYILRSEELGYSFKFKK